MPHIPQLTPAELTAAIAEYQRRSTHEPARFAADRARLDLPGVPTSESVAAYLVEISDELVTAAAPFERALEWRQLDHPEACARCGSTIPTGSYAARRDDRVICGHCQDQIDQATHRVATRQLVEAPR